MPLSSPFGAPESATAAAATPRLARALAVLAAVLVALSGSAAAQQAAPAAGVVRAAETFLATLTPEQRKSVSYAFTDEEQRARWSNFPTGFVPRGGIDLRQMSQPQRDAAIQLLATVLSPMGLEKINEIREADDDFKAHGSRRGPPGGHGGSRPGGPPPGGGGPPPAPGRAGGGPGRGPHKPVGDMFGSELYYISFLGTPSDTSPWMLQFGGHHLALNVTIDGGQGILTPSLTGAQPASFTLGGRTVRPLGRESDKALALMKSLDESQRRQATLTYSVPDLVLGPGQDGKQISPEGLKVSAMTTAQRSMLLDLISEWAGILNDAAAATRMAQVKDELDATWFAWSGPTATASTGNITAYYRIQGPHLVIEYAPQHDEPGNHVHTIYRDPTNDYGRAPARP